MNHCDRCNKDYSEDFKFCPIDGTVLQTANQPVPVAHVGNNGRSTSHKWIWLWSAVGIVIVLGAVLVYTSRKTVQPPVPADAGNAAADQGQSIAPPPAKRTPASPRRGRRADAEQVQSRSAADGLVQQVRVQQLVATGYRRLQQRDYEGARDVFEEALDADPHNAAAEKGLKAAQTASSVQGVVGVFQH